MTNTTLKILTLSLISYNGLQAAPLSSYRGAAAETAAFQNSVKQLSSEILKLLGETNPNLDLLENPSPTEKGSSRRNNSSLMIKSNMLKGIREIVRQEKYGKPLVFTPSSTTSAEDSIEVKRQSRIKICRQVYPRVISADPTKKADSPLDHLLEEMKEIFDSSAAKKDSVIINPSAAIQTILNPFSKSLSKNFGNLSGLEIKEGSIHALRFNRDGKESFLTLSILTTFLTDEDEAFIAMLDCLLDESQTQAATAEKNLKENIDKVGAEFNKKYYGSLVSALQPRLDKAHELNESLKNLEGPALRTLLSILLRAQINEIPAGEEVDVIQKKTGDRINQALANNHRDLAEQISTDVAYFSEIQQQLSRLKDVLTEKAALKIQTSEIIRDELKGLSK